MTITESGCMVKLNKNESLIVIACAEESNNLIEKLGVDILYTGVGKINAAYYLTKVLTERKIRGNLPKYVINVGSCGSKKFSKGKLIACNEFIQRDMDCSCGEYKLGETPREKDLYVIKHRKVIDDLEYGICGTGDNFATKSCEIREVDLCEMEGYSLAKVCKLENIDFISIKYITDGLDEKGSEDWNDNILDCATSFYNYLSGILQ